MKRCFDRSFYYWTRDKQGKVGRLFRARRKPRYLLKEDSMNLGSDRYVIHAKVMSVEEIRHKYGAEI